MKKKKLLRETDPNRYMKVKPPPLPVMRPRIILNHNMMRRYGKYYHNKRRFKWRGRRGFYEGGKTLILNNEGGENNHEDKT